MLGLKDFKMILRVTTAQLQLLREYDLWSMKMEQYLTHTDYALWEVIVNGDAPAAVTSASTVLKVLFLLKLRTKDSKEE
ncbi:hypothetical protein Tco_1062198 [Tanacetum coccineum]